MTVKELIEILQELTKEARVNFQVGDGEIDAYMHAKVQLKNGGALSFMKIEQVDMYRSLDDDLDDDIMVDIRLHDHAYTIDGFYKNVNRFDEIAKNIDLIAKLKENDKY